jgi:hypothetical protein
MADGTSRARNSSGSPMRNGRRTIRTIPTIRMRMTRILLISQGTEARVIRHSTSHAAT